jgi:alpha-tubulin suppressor-like RCC1 family protein
MGLGALATGGGTGCGGGEATVPPAVPLTGVAAISAGGSHACAVVQDGTARCWGSGIAAELGIGIALPQAHPVTVPGLSGVAALAPGGEFTCALMADQTVDCWGDQIWGELGNGTISAGEQIAPAPAVGLTGVIALGARGVAPLVSGFARQFACALTSGGGVDCWGSNEDAELGIGAPDASSLNAVATPGPVTGVSGAIALGLGDQHACAVRAGGEVSCWGFNLAGQLGDGTHVLGAYPVAVAGLAGPAVAVAGGGLHTCALLADRTIECWGGNSEGEIGDGTTTDAPAPVVVTGLAGITGITAGASHTCALRADGTIWCWGLMWLGDGQAAGSAVPVQVEGVSSAVAIAAGEYFTCALLADSSVACWGENEDGQLGDGSMASSVVPVAVTLALGP